MKKSLQQSISLLNIFKTSILTVIGMISFFFLMNLFNLHTILELRYLNFLFIFFGVRNVLLHKQSVDAAKVRFHPAMMMGFLTVFFTASLFSAFIFTLLNLDSSFMLIVKRSQPFGIYLSPAVCALVTFLEGVASGAIVSIPVLLTFRRARNAATESISQLAN
ncbi:MAG: hypothetical protein NTV09_12565 [Bacteroidetes bacterium]|nr:hypothetical protein [Bacteroidota bacterium]